MSDPPPERDTADVDPELWHAIVPDSYEESNADEVDSALSEFDVNVVVPDSYEESDADDVDSALSESPENEVGEVETSLQEPPAKSQIVDSNPPMSDVAESMLRIHLPFLFEKPKK